MTRPEVPVDVAAAAAARSKARERRDWREADRLRTEIEAAGWTIVDDGARFRLRPSHPADLDIAGVVRHGWSGSVPRRDPGERRPGVTVAVITDADPDVTTAAIDRARAVRTAFEHLGETTIVAVIDGLGRATSPVLDTADLEAIATASPVGPAGGLDIVTRRALGSRLLMLPATGSLDSSVLERVVLALDDPAVAIAGVVGLSLRRLPRFDSAEPDSADAVHLGYAAFRLDDVVGLGPIDLRFRTWVGVGAWLSQGLVAAAAPGRPRRVAVVDAGHGAGAVDGVGDTAPDAAARRDGYRLIRVWA